MYSVITGSLDQLELIDLLGILPAYADLAYAVPVSNPRPQLTLRLPMAPRSLILHHASA